jgi:integrase
MKGELAWQGQRPAGSSEAVGQLEALFGGLTGIGSNAVTVNYPTREGFMESVLLDVAGHRRSPVTMPGYHRGRPPRNEGEQYPADPPTVEEIIAVMRTVGNRAEGNRLRALIVLLWRAGLRISEALALQESDLDRSRGAVLVRHGKGGKRREVGMDRWGKRREQLHPWLEIRREHPTGAVLCVIHGPTAGRRWEASAARKQLHHAAEAAGVRRRFAPHQLGPLTRWKWPTRASRSS